MKFRFSLASESGPRASNEDAVGVWPVSDSGFAVAIADGLGGYHGGQQASETAIQMFGMAATNIADFDLLSLALSIHEAIRKKQSEDAAVRGMATTLSGAIVSEDSIRFVHCGDTRIALQRNNGIRRLTTDHTEAQRLLDANILTREEYATYPRKNVLESALGVSTTPRIDIGSHDIIAGDRLILTSDGVHSKVYAREIRDIIVRSSNPADAVCEISETVSSRHAEDNFTVAVIYIDYPKTKLRIKLAKLSCNSPVTPRQSRLVDRHARFARAVVGRGCR